jgi:hypothetical protein
MALRCDAELYQKTLEDIARHYTRNIQMCLYMSRHYKRRNQIKMMNMKVGVLVNGCPFIMSSLIVLFELKHLSVGYCFHLTCTLFSYPILL